MKAAIITSSDSGYAGEREDKSGSVIQEILEANDYEVVHTILLPDDRKMLADEMARMRCRADCNYGWNRIFAERLYAGGNKGYYRT